MVILGVRWPLGRILDVLQIMALVRRYLADGQALERGVPAGRIVSSAFPRVIDDDQSALGRIARGCEIAVPPQNLRIQLANAIDDWLYVLVRCKPQNPQ